MKKTKFLFIVLVGVLVLGLSGFALAKSDNAQTGNAEQNQNQNQGEDIQNQEREQEGCVNKCGDENCEEVVCMGTGCPCTETKASCPKDCDVNDEENQEQENEQKLGEKHRSTVSNFVQELENVADNENSGIGEQVRLIAQEQNQVREKIADEIESIQERNKIKTFLFGSNYKNLGALRSEMVQTRNRLEKLTRLMEQTTNEADKTELQNQIQTMEEERLRIENFVEENESKFSLFGWLVKLFSKKSE